jgi:MinD-like ATPase involved in chromosome partitioning or flagellar assembly
MPIRHRDFPGDRNSYFDPITWVDVARRLTTIEPTASEWVDRPKGLLRAQVNWSGLILEVRTAQDSKSAIEWLGKIFPRRVANHGHLHYTLSIDGPPHADKLPIEIEINENFAAAGRIPLGTIEPIVDFRSPRLSNNSERLKVIACHSVKGGTGRTTIAVAVAKLWQEKTGKPILLVDADLEAPGISYLFRNARTESRVALEDLIALAHSDASIDYKNTIDYVASRLSDHQLEDGIIVLPLCRDLDELASSSIRAEHLSRPDRPFALADIIDKLARACGCAGAVVDLRAGLVPLSVQFVLDPSVSRIFSTSLSGQSLEATAALVKFVSREMRRNGVEFPPPLIVVNRVPSVLRETGADDALLRPILDKMTQDVLRGHQQEVEADQPLLEDELEISPWRISKIAEISDLQVTSVGWAGFSEQIKSSGFMRRLATDMDAWLDQEQETGGIAESSVLPPSDLLNDTKTRRQKLFEFANRLVAAETADQPVETPLVTGPLLAIAKQFVSQLPIIVTEGAKGTGKTLTARFLVNKASWDSAVYSLSKEHPTSDAFIVPVLGSIQTSEKFQSEIDKQRVNIAQKLGFKAPQRVDQTKAALLAKMKERTASGRVSLWLDAIAWSIGFEVNKDGAGERLLKFLEKSNQRILALVEGIEELYSDPFTGKTPSILRSLLVDLPLRLRGEPGRPLGLVVFARRDSVDAAVPQNKAQFRITYKDFELSWSDDDVLELAAWLATKAGSLDLWHEGFRDLPQIEKERQLEQLWGRKLGPDDKPGARTKEAYTAAWVIAALSDLQGRLVARDLVRFLADAAKFSPTTTEDDQYSTRLLVPRALKQAIKPTSIAKVKETEEEIRELKSVFAKFQRRKKDIRAPIDQADIKALRLVGNDIDLLRRHGILFGEAPPYEVPELFRMGLNLKHSGARYSVINLRRKARQRVGIQS